MGWQDNRAQKNNFTVIKKQLKCYGKTDAFDQNEPECDLAVSSSGSKIQNMGI
jgi:hypothetical protein